MFQCLGSRVEASHPQCAGVCVWCQTAAWPHLLARGCPGPHPTRCAGFPFSVACFWLLRGKRVAHTCVGLFLGSQLCCRFSCCFDHCSFAEWLQVKVCSFFSGLHWLFRVFCGSTQTGRCFGSVSVEKAVGALTSNALRLHVAVSTWPLGPRYLPTCEHRTSPSFCVPSPVSPNSTWRSVRRSSPQ